MTDAMSKTAPPNIPKHNLALPSLRPQPNISPATTPTPRFHEMPNLHTYYLTALQHFLEDSSYTWEPLQLRSWWRIISTRPSLISRCAYLGDSTLRQMLERLVNQICQNVPQNDRHAIREALLSNEAFGILMRYNNILLGPHNASGRGKCYGDHFEAMVGFAEEDHGQDHVYRWAERTFTPLVQALDKAYHIIPTGQRMSRKGKVDLRAEHTPSRKSVPSPISPKSKSASSFAGSPSSGALLHSGRSLLDRLGPPSTLLDALTAADNVSTDLPVKPPSRITFVMPSHRLHLSDRLNLILPNHTMIEGQTSSTAA